MNVDTRLDTTVDLDDGELQSADGASHVGELLVRGPSVTEGYWNRSEATESAFVSLSDATDEPEWFRTGDLIEQGPDGYLTFLGRRKQRLVLSTGLNIVPGPIEEAITESPLVEQCLLVGDGRPTVGALVVPDFEAVRRWADREGINLPSQSERLIADERVRSHIAAAVDQATDGAEPHEQLGGVAFITEPFSVDNGLLTPTLKKKRQAIAERYADRIGRLYE